jgi:hypothetical protein
MSVFSFDVVVRVGRALRSVPGAPRVRAATLHPGCTFRLELHYDARSPGAERRQQPQQGLPHLAILIRPLLRVLVKRIDRGRLQHGLAQGRLDLCAQLLGARGIGGGEHRPLVRGEREAVRAAAERGEHLLGVDADAGAEAVRARLDLDPDPHPL